MRIIRFAAAGVLATGIAGAVFAAPARADDTPEGVRVTGEDPDWWKVHSAGPDGVRVTGEDPDWWSYHSDPDGVRVTGEDPDMTHDGIGVAGDDAAGVRVTSRDW